MKNVLKPIKEDISGLKTDVSGLKEGQAKINIKLENNIEKKLVLPFKGSRV